MWLVGVYDRTVRGHRKWHFLVRDEDVIFPCGHRNPPWHFVRLEDGTWQETDEPHGIARAEPCDPESVSTIRTLPAESRCACCWLELEKAVIAAERSRLVAAKASEGKPEVTVGSIVTLLDVETQELSTYFLGAESQSKSHEVCSPESTIGKAVVGRFVGDELSVSLPGGKVRYLVENVAESNDRDARATQ